MTKITIITLLTIISISAIPLYGQEEKAAKPKIEADFSLQLTGQCLSLSSSLLGDEGTGGIYPFAGAMLKAQCDLRLGQHWIISPMYEMGLSRSQSFIADLGCGVGQVLLDKARYRQDIILTPFMGSYGYFDFNTFYGARLEWVHRLTFVGYLKGIASIGVEWSGNNFNIPISLGLSL
jgi:hypothetical protein